MDVAVWLQLAGDYSIRVYNTNAHITGTKPMFLYTGKLQFSCLKFCVTYTQICNIMKIYVICNAEFCKEDRASFWCKKRE